MIFMLRHQLIHLLSQDVCYLKKGKQELSRVVVLIPYFLSFPVHNNLKLGQQRCEIQQSMDWLLSKLFLNGMPEAAYASLEYFHCNDFVLSLNQRKSHFPLTIAKTIPNFCSPIKDWLVCKAAQ